MVEIAAQQPLRVVAVSGSLHIPSKTSALLDAILDRVAREQPIDAHIIELTAIGPEFAGALTREQLPPSVERELVRIENADLLIVASPVYRGSFTGLFKHLFDFVGQYSLVDKPVLVAATGGGDRHALILEHQFRPLFGFFQALTLPIGVYASNSDFTDYALTSPAVQERIDLAVQRGLPFVRNRVRDAGSVSDYVGAW
ncbi:FMN reductase [Mycetocola zhujimingii]|uniref:FMN reductase n=1 Tax=Mycetocola zhujimingii TaxID=2079792 RepID=A0A2U1TI41_9MICO|nr:FMN reductase [Mycetocola zhujimingii]PWC08557.1 FMN reductase [Mycetocola zhujimingii]